MRVRIPPPPDRTVESAREAGATRVTGFGPAYQADDKLYRQFPNDPPSSVVKRSVAS